MIIDRMREGTLPDRYRSDAPTTGLGDAGPQTLEASSPSTSENNQSSLNGMIPDYIPEADVMLRDMIDRIAHEGIGPSEGMIVESRGEEGVEVGQWVLYGVERVNTQDGRSVWVVDLEHVLVPDLL
jgi:hypothetical protein